MGRFNQKSDTDMKVENLILSEWRLERVGPLARMLCDVWPWYTIPQSLL